MERDFLGMNTKDSSVVVKEESVDGFKDSGFVKASGFPWSLSNKVSAFPPFMSLKPPQDEKMLKVNSDHLTASGYMTASSANALFDVKQESVEAQNIHQMHHTHEAKMFPLSMSNLKRHFAGAGQNFAGAKQQFVGGVPVAAPRSFTSFMAGTTEPWSTFKASANAAQLTIFYGGTVNVFDDISPEKAQAIMIMAGNSCNMSQMRLPVRSPSSKFAAGDAAFVNQTINPQSSSALSSPISVSSHPLGQSGVGSGNNDEVKVSKTIGSMVASLGHVPATAMMPMPSAVPQARKASLARFLEKRKERAMNSSPYNSNKKSAVSSKPDLNTNPDCSATTFAGCSLVSTGIRMP